MSEFRFKQFTIIQDKTAMKLSTDSVLLGAWADAKNPAKILDIGTGTGVIALMLAQRFKNAEITAIEIEKNAFCEAKKNAKNSPWHNRINILHNDFLNFAKNTSIEYDLIVSNPPFFENQLLPNDKNKQIARHTTKLPFDKLSENVAKLLSDKGYFCVIIPYNQCSNFVHLCSKSGLFASRKNTVFPTEKKQPNRILLQFNKKTQHIVNQTITIRKNNIYTNEYLELTKDFYLFA